MVTVKKTLIFIGTVFILVLSIISFVFIPTIGGSASSPISFGEWDGTPVEYTQDSFFVRQIENISNLYKNAGMQIDTRNLYTIMRQAFDSTIVRLAILGQMEEVGYTPSNTEINRNLIQRYYSDADGKFQEAYYNRTSDTEKIARRTMMTEELMVVRYLTDFVGDENNRFGMKTGAKELDLVKEMLSPERSFYYVSFSASDYPESEVGRFGGENAELFATLNLSMITTDNESEAARVLNLIRSGETTFDEAVAAYSTKRRTDSDGKIISNMRKDVNMIFPDAADLETVVTLAPGEISPVIRSGISYVIVRCDGQPTPADFSQEETLAVVRDYMQRNERGTIEDYLMAMARDFADKASADGFDETAAGLSKTKNETAPICINYGNASVLTSSPADSDMMLAAAVNDERFFKTAFGLKSGEVSDPVMVGDEAVVLLLKEESAADPERTEIYQQAYTPYTAEWTQREMNAAYLSSGKFKNNFDATFLRYFIPE